MKLDRQQLDSNQAGRASRRAAPLLALLLAVTWSGVFQATNTTAQESSLLHLFDGLRRGSTTPEVEDKAQNTAAAKSDEAAPKLQPAGKVQWKPQLVSGENKNAAEAGNVETLPAPRVQGTVPLSGWDEAQNIQLSQRQGWIEVLSVRDVPLSHVLSMLAQTQGLNIVASNDIDATISITLHDVPLEEALTAILSVANYTWVRKNNIILVTSLSDANQLSADVQGRQIQVFPLDFASATQVADSVTGFLSPVGKVTTSVSDPANNRRTRELVVVEDVPSSLERIAAYIHCVDRPPRQVEIEAHVLQVTLKDNNKHGVDFDALFRVAGAAVNVGTTGFANAEATPAFLATIKSKDLNAVLELLESTTDTKTLGSPKLLVVNEQEASMQVGQQLGFRVTTTTETSTLESVQFLDVGVVLTMRPRITRDGRVMLHVKPEVSSGQVSVLTGLPEEETTQLETDVILDDGQGMILGGLIKEMDSVVQTKVPVIGDVWGIGKLFQRSETDKERVEIVIAIVPRIQPYDPGWNTYEQGELAQAGTQLFHGPLCRTDRPFDSVLPDGERVSRPWVPLCAYPEDYRCRRGPNSDYLVTPHPRPVQNFYGPDFEPGQNYEPGPDGEPGPEGPFMWQGDGPPQASSEVVAPPTSQDQAHQVEIISDQD
jgi:type IV pilus assembly protein PilQ